MNYDYENEYYMLNSINKKWMTFKVLNNIFKTYTCIWMSIKKKIINLKLKDKILI